MKTRLIKHSMFMLSFLLFSSYLNAVVVWQGGFTPDVINDDLILDGGLGDIRLSADPSEDCEVVIRATTQDVNVTLTNGPITVSSIPSDLTQLTIEGEAGNTVIFHIDDDLSFKGVASDTRTLVIHVRPLSSDFNVEFRMKGGNTVSFTADADSGPAQLWLELLPGTATPGSILRFTRDVTESSPEQDQNVNITVGRDSLLGYIDSLAHPSAGAGFATIQFDPSNATDKTGRMVLTIEDRGSIIVSPRFFTDERPDQPCITVDRTVLGAGIAFLQVVNTNGQAGLQVINENSIYSELLVDPFCNLGTRNDTVNYNGTFSGIQWGFIVGANGELNIGDNSFLDYIGTQTDMCPTVTAIPGHSEEDCDSGCDCDCSCATDVSGLIKARNGSALIIDGSNFPDALPAAMNFGINSGLYLRSGVNCLGFVENYEGVPFAIDPLSESCGAGLIVFDVEGPLNVTGSNSGDTLRSKIEILSLMVNPFGGPLFWNGTQTIFPIRTFDVDTNGEFIQYNKAAMLVNNRMNLANMALDHTDQIHNVYENNSVQSEPTYIGGETFTLKDNVARPKIAFHNSYFLVHTNVGVTGVDLLVPNSHTDLTSSTVCIDNTSHFTFFNNGKRVDSGTGRFMILGTQPGSFACDGCSVISRDAHLDVLQDSNCTNDADTLDHLLKLDVTTNNTLVNNEINPAENINGQFSIQTIFLGFASNISIGTQANTTGFDFDTLPELRICGNYFSFDTQGGTVGIPEYSGVTGEGGIFVDLNGTISIADGYQASVGTMVTKSLNGVIDLPKNQVLFDSRVGISNWNLESNSIIISEGQCLSDYTLYWIAVNKDYDVFCPYLVDNVNSCTCPAVTQENVEGMPVIAGTVQQFQIKDSRLGDPANIKIVSGGIVEELVFLSSNKSAVAPTAVVILEDDGRVGLGSEHRNVDSLCASFVLGINGVTIIANGDGKVVLNEDMIINNVCSILRGPDFNSGADEGILRITSDRTHNIYVTSNGTLDLRSFNEGDRVQIEGNVQVILEPGARVLLDGVELLFADEACMLTEKYDLIFSAFQDATSLASTDDFRVSLIGTGTISLTDCSCFFVQEDSFVGVETLFEFNGTETCEIPATDLSIVVRDSAQFIIGTDCEEEAGAFQVGNTADHDGHTVRFNLTMAGSDGIARIRKGGFLGLATGIVQKNAASVPNSWTIDNTFNVTNITIDVIDGLFAHDRIYSGDNQEAALIAIGDDSSTVFSFLYEHADTEQEFRSANASIHGGGNIVRITPNGGTPIQPIVLNTDDDSGRVRTGILASRPLLADTNEAVLVSGDELFTAIKTLDTNAVNRCADFGNFAQGVQAFRQGHTGIRTGYILGDAIIRFDAFDFFGPGTQESKRQRAIDLGAGYIRVANTSSPQESTFASVIPS